MENQTETVEVTEATEVAHTSLADLEVLEAQAHDLNARLETAKKAAYQEAVNTIRELMVKFGIEHFSVGKKKVKKHGGTVAPKYQNPNGEGTWTGRGKPCKWYLEAIEAGYTPEDMLINK